MNKLSNEEIQRRLDENNLYDSKIIFNTIIKYNDKNSHFICGYCGNEFNMSLNSFLKSKYRVCQNCYHKVQDTKLRNVEEIKKEVIDYGYIPLFEDYNGQHNRILVKDNDGYKGLVQIYTLRNGGNISKFAKYNPYTIENINLYCSINNINCFIPEQEYLGWDLPLKVVCECGSEYITTATNLLYGNKIQCNRCSNIQSNIEKLVEDWLKNNNINYTSQHKFNNCRYKRELPFDFYIENIGLIEVDGIGHFEPTKFNGINIIKAEELFKNTKIRDKIKDEYCKDNNINLLRIPYWEIENSNIYKEKLSLFVH